jgi:hypothetical protein
MKKLMVMLALLSLLVSNAYAFGFKFDLFGYTIKYQEPMETKVITGAAPTPVQQYSYSKSEETTIVHSYDQYIKELNNIKEVQNSLKDLGYSRIGFKDKDTNIDYTVFVSEEGLIQSVYRGNFNPEVQISGSLSTIEYLANSGQFEALRDEVDIPWSVRIKLIVMNVIPG